MFLQSHWQKKKTLTAINGSKGEIFNPEDPQKMCQVIKQVKKPCITYKIFGAGRLCHDKNQIYNAFKFAVMNIKKDDFIMVGVFIPEIQKPDKRKCRNTFNNFIRKNFLNFFLLSLSKL